MPRRNFLAAISSIPPAPVTEQSGVVAEAYELVEEGLLGKTDFKAFTFGNVAELHSQMNPDFFKNTVVENQVERHMRPRSGCRSGLISRQIAPG